MRILVAEDDAILADGLLKSLRQAGYAVDWAKGGAEADAALAAQPYDLAILDIGLPKMSGLEVLSRQRGRNSNLPVLILTALNGVDDRVRGGPERRDFAYWYRVSLGCGVTIPGGDYLAHALAASIHRRPRHGEATDGA